MTSKWEPFHLMVNEGKWKNPVAVLRADCQCIPWERQDASLNQKQTVAPRGSAT